MSPIVSKQRVLSCEEASAMFFGFVVVVEKRFCVVDYEEQASPFREKEKHVPTHSVVKKRETTL